MTQKLCSRCQTQLTPTERAVGEIQCARCYEQWLYEAVPAAEPEIRRILNEIYAERNGKPALPSPAEAALAQMV